MSAHRDISGVIVTPSNIHRQNAYGTDCSCSKHVFPLFRDAKRHMAECDRATVVLYNEHYGDPRVVFRKEEL